MPPHLRPSPRRNSPRLGPPARARRRTWPAPPLGRPASSRQALPPGGRTRSPTQPGRLLCRPPGQAAQRDVLIMVLEGGLKSGKLHISKHKKIIKYHIIYLQPILSTVEMDFQNHVACCRDKYLSNHKSAPIFSWNSSENASPTCVKKQNWFTTLNASSKKKQLTKCKQNHPSLRFLSGRGNIVSRTQCRQILQGPRTNHTNGKHFA